MSRKTDLESLIQALKNADHRDDTQFYELLRQGIVHLALTDKAIAHEFGVSRPTVNRWKNGRNSPHPAMRKPIYDWLLKKAKSALRIAEREEKRASCISASPALTSVPMLASGPKGD